MVIRLLLTSMEILLQTVEVLLLTLVLIILVMIEIMVKHITSKLVIRQQDSLTAGTLNQIIQLYNLQQHLVML